MRGLIGIVGRMVMVAVAAILIGGCLAAPAGAQTRDDGVKEANDFVDACFQMGGQPDVPVADHEMIVAHCRLPDGSDFVCVWGDVGGFTGWNQDCDVEARPVPGGGLPTLEPGDLSTLEPEADEPAIPPVVSAPDDNQADEQVAKPKPKKKKQAKKAKKGNGKGKGKAKQRGKGRGGR